jgi:hypothetical protein
MTPGRFARYDPNDLDDLRTLVASGLIWRGGPKTVQRAMEAIVAGNIDRPTRNVPASVDAYLDRRGVAREG